MAFLEHAISLDDLPESTGDGEFKPLPEGWYSATITKTDVRNYNENAGQYMSVRFDITGPTHQGRVVFSNITIKHNDSERENKGRSHLGNLMRACGLNRVTDTDQFVGGNLSIKLGVTEARTDKVTGKTYEAGNSVKAFKSSGDAMPSASTIPSFSKPAAAAPKTDGAAPPWAKK
jgi:hypothetical protein